MLRISRRTVIAGTTASLLPISAKGTGSVSLGHRRLTSVSDGHLVLLLPFPLPEVPETECNLTVMEDGDRLVLFDAGAGPNFMPTTDQLGGALASAGIEPEAVTDVIFSHAHPDHLWGIIDDFDEITFPEARLYVGRTEWNYWRADDTIDTIGEARQAFAVGARDRYAAIEESVQLFDAGEWVIPGVEAVDTSGHTPGHMSFAVHTSDVCPGPRRCVDQPCDFVP